MIISAPSVSANNYDHGHDYDYDHDDDEELVNHILLMSMTIILFDAHSVFLS